MSRGSLVMLGVVVGSLGAGCKGDTCKQVPGPFELDTGAGEGGCEPLPAGAPDEDLGCGPGDNEPWSPNPKPPSTFCGDGDGDFDPDLWPGYRAGDGDGDGDPDPVCGNGILEPGEDCEADPEDGRCIGCCVVCDEGLSDCGTLECKYDLQNDPKHCGSCYHECYGTECSCGRCVVPEPTVIFEDGSITSPVVTDGEFVWFGRGEETIRRLPIGGGDAEVLYTLGHSPFGLELHCGWLYWMRPNGLHRAPADGTGEIEDIGGVGWAEFAVDADYLYWTTTDHENPSAPVDIYRQGHDGSNVELLLSQIVVDRLRVDLRHLYWTGGGLHRMDKTGGPVVLHASGGSPSGLTVTDSSVWWVSSGRVASVRKDACGVSWAEVSDATRGLVVDENNAYVGVEDGAVAVPVGGGPPVRILESEGVAIVEAQDDVSVLVTINTSMGSGYPRTLVRIAKP